MQKRSATAQLKGSQANFQHLQWVHERYVRKSMNAMFRRDLNWMLFVHAIPNACLLPRPNSPESQTLIVQDKQSDVRCAFAGLPGTGASQETARNPPTGPAVATAAVPGPRIRAHPAPAAPIGTVSRWQKGWTACSLKHPLLDPRRLQGLKRSQPPQKRARHWSMQVSYQLVQNRTPSWWRVRMRKGR